MASYDRSANKSAAELEREVEMQRGRLSDTIDELQTRLSPGQLLDQVMDMTKFQAGDFAQNMSRSVTSNPLPVALVGLGLFWLMAGKNPAQSSGHDSYSNRDDGSYRNGVYHDPYYDDRPRGEGLAGGIKHAAEEIGEKVSDAASAAGDALHQAGEKLTGMRDAAGEQIAGAQGEMRRRTHDLRDHVNHRAQDLGHQMSQMQSSAMQMFRDQPLIAAALAFAAGAAVGAAVPVTAKEHEVMGEASDQVKAAVKDAAAPLVEKGKAVLGQAVEHGKTVVAEAVDEGKTALAEEYKTIKDEVATTIDEATTDPAKTPTI